MKSSLKKHVNTVFGVLVGNAILAFTVAAFIVPHGVIMGGATGIGLTIAHYVPVDLSIIIFIVNSILFVLGAAVLGKKFAVATIASTINAATVNARIAFPTRTQKRCSHVSSNCFSFPLLQ